MSNIQTQEELVRAGKRLVLSLAAEIVLVPSILWLGLLLLGFPVTQLSWVQCLGVVLVGDIVMYLIRKVRVTDDN